MRTLRLSLAGMVILALLGGLGGAVLAQSEAPDRPQAPTEMRATLECGFDDHGSTSDLQPIGPVEGGDLVRYGERGQVHRPVEVSVDDRRFEGEHFFHISTYSFRGPGLDPDYVPELVSATWRTENDAGAWQGSAETVFFAGNPGTTYNMVLAGEGAYEGLSAIWVVRFGSIACRWTIHGLVFEGEMPPMPEPLEPAD